MLSMWPYLKSRNDFYQACKISFQRWRYFEFWPWWLFYIPVFFYLIYLVIRFRSLTVCTSVNPIMPLSGLRGTKKSLVLDKIPAYVPRSTVIEKATKDNILSLIDNFGLPLVIKPENGQRGMDVFIIDDKTELKRAAEILDGQDVLVQEKLNGEEYGVFYYRYPDQEHGVLHSITNKIRPQIIGDGQTTLRELILYHERLSLMAPYLLPRWGDELDHILDDGQVFEAVPLGTHSKGAVFANSQDLRTEELRMAFDKIADQIDGFYFGRFDIKAPDHQALQEGTGIQVMEVNGLTSEPGHIYAPRYSLFKAYMSLFHQWYVAFDIGQKNEHNGVERQSLVDLYKEYKHYQNA